MVAETKEVEVVATRVGEYHGYRSIGDKFFVPEHMATKSSWWKPLEVATPEEAAPAKPKKQEPTTLSELGKHEQKDERGRGWKK